MKALRTRLAGAGLSITDLQFYNHFVPANYDIIIAVHDPSPLYSVDTLCERFRAIELRRELRTGGTIEDPIALPRRTKRDQEVSKSPMTGC